MKKSVLLFVVSIAFASLSFCQEPLEQWAHNHAKASEALGEWVKHHPETARVLFEWDGSHPERAQEFVTWSIEHNRERVTVFLGRHPDWRGMDVFAERHAGAMDEFMFWCRNHPEAARALMAHPRGLRWAGDHLYREYWNMGRPRR